MCRIQQCLDLEEYEEMIDFIEWRHRLWMEERAELFRYRNQFRIRNRQIEACPF